MDFTPALAIRDETIKDILVDELSKITSPEQATSWIEDAFSSVDKLWRSKLIYVMGEEDASVVLGAFEQVSVRRAFD